MSNNRKLGRQKRSEKNKRYKASNRRGQNKLRRVMRSSGEAEAVRWKAVHGKGAVRFTTRKD